MSTVRAEVAVKERYAGAAQAREASLCREGGNC